MKKNKKIHYPALGHGQGYILIDSYRRKDGTIVRGHHRKVSNRRNI